MSHLVQFLIYFGTTIAAITSFWYGTRNRIASLKQELAMLNRDVSELKKNRAEFEATTKAEAAYLRDRVENVDKHLVKISTELEIHNTHLDTMLQLMIKRIEKIEEQQKTL